MKVGQRVNILNKGSSFFGYSGTVVRRGSYPDTYGIKLDTYSACNGEPIVFYISELRLTDKCPCKIKNCISSHQGVSS